MLGILTNLLDMSTNLSNIFIDLKMFGKVMIYYFRASFKTQFKWVLVASCGTVYGSLIV